MKLNVKNRAMSSNASARARNRLLGIIVALSVVVIICIMTAISTAEAKKTITVCRIKNDAPLSANSMIMESMIEPYEMYYKEFSQYGTIKMSDGSTRSTIVRWADRDLVVNKRYAAYYMRQGTVLFWDATLRDQTRKNSYLYSMDGELLNIKMTTTEDFGDMVVPGDKLNIRASYTKKEYNLTDEEVYMRTGEMSSEDGTDVDVVEPLFSEVQVLDMLNSSGESIFDIYYEYISMSKVEQAAKLQDETFLSSVKPSSILLEVTAEEVEHFMSVSKNGATYQITLLPRTGSSAIIDSLSEIQEALRGVGN